MPPTNRVEGFSLSHAQVCDGATNFIDSLAQMASQSLDVYGVSDSSLDVDTDNYDNEGDDAILSRWNWINTAEVKVEAGYLSFPLLSQLTGRPVNTTTTTNVSEVQTIASSGATAGTFTLTFRGQTTGPIAYNAAASAVQTALQALSTVGAGNVLVTGGPANTTALVLTFAGALANQAVPNVVVDKTGLTGAGATGVTETTPGSAAGQRDEIDLWHEDSFNVAPKPMLTMCPARDENGVTRRLVIGLYKVSFMPITFDGPKYKDGLKVSYGGTALMSPVDETGAVFSDGKKRVGRLIAIS